MEKLKIIIPVAGAIAVIGAVSYSLGSYNAPVYTPEDFAIESNININADDKSAPVTPPLLADEKAVSETADAADRLASAGNTAPLSSNASSIPADAVYKDGVYRGSADGFRGPIDVEVTIADGKIADIAVLSNSDDPEYFNRALSIIDAVKSSQNTSVDTVSGATYSSVGIINAIANALNQALVSGASAPAQTPSVASGGENVSVSGTNPAAGNQSAAPSVSEPVRSGSFKDGKYRGTGEGFNGTIEVELNIENDKITDINVINSNDDPEFFNRALSILEAIKSTQSTAVDTVSGATYSSVGLLNACNDALKKAVNTETSDSSGTISIAEAASDNGSSAETSTVSVNNAKTYFANASIGSNTKSSANNIKSYSDTAVSVNPDSSSGISYNDGTYTVSAYCNKDYADDNFDEYILSMDITIKNGRISSVDNISSDDGDKTNARFIERAASSLVPAIIKAGNAQGLDTVSGATYSSDSILRACLNVFKLADSEAEDRDNMMPF